MNSSGVGSTTLKLILRLFLPKLTSSKNLSFWGFKCDIQMKPFYSKFGLVLASLGLALGSSGPDMRMQIWLSIQNNNLRSFLGLFPNKFLPGILYIVFFGWV